MIRPGATQLTVMPSAATCIDKALDQLVIAALAGVAAFIPLSASEAVTVMILPQRACRMAGNAHLGETAGCGEVEADRLVPRSCIRRRIELVAAAAAGIVDQHLDRPLSLRDRRSRHIDAGRLREVAGDDAEHGRALRDNHVASSLELALVTSRD